MFQRILNKYYEIFLFVLIGGMIFMAYSLGKMGATKPRGGSDSVALLCDGKILKTLEISLNEDKDKNLFSKEEPAFDEQFVGSKNGTKYYTQNCKGVERIKPENMKWFKSEQDAILQGYTKAQC